MGKNRKRKLALLAVFCAFAIPATLFIPSQGSRATATKNLTATGVEYAVRLSNSPGIGSGADSLGRGYIYLADSSGKGQYRKTEFLIGSSVIWSGDSIFFGDSSNEFIITPDATLTFPREKKEEHEVVRYPTKEGNSMVMYTLDHFQPVLTISNQGVIEKGNNEGWYLTNTVCDSHFYSVASTHFLPDYLRARALRDYPQSGDTSNLHYDLLIDIATTEGAEPRIIGATPENKDISGTENTFVCYKDHAIIPHEDQHNNPPPDRLTTSDEEISKYSHNKNELVFDEWNLNDGSRQIVPITDADGRTIQVGDSYIDSITTHIEGNILSFMTRHGDVYRIDMDTHTLLSRDNVGFNPTNPPDSAITYANNSFYYVATNLNDHSQEITLKRFDLDTRTVSDVTTLQGLTQLRKGNFLTGPLYLQSLAVKEHTP